MGLPDSSERFPRIGAHSQMAPSARMEMLVCQKLCAMRKALEFRGPHDASERCWEQFWAVGDGEFEMYAAHDLFFEMSSKKLQMVKTIKMFNEPSLEDLTNELVAMEQTLNPILGWQKSCHLDFDLLDMQMYRGLDDLLRN